MNLREHQAANVFLSCALNACRVVNFTCQLPNLGLIPSFVPGVFVPCTFGLRTSGLRTTTPRRDSTYFRDATPT
jgi:hypothetical protein